MSEPKEWFSGPVDGVVFAVIMVMAAFLGRENPDFIYPEILVSFLALLVFNFINFSILPRYVTDQRRVALAVGLNIVFLIFVLHFSGGSESYFWVLYLLPLFNACLAFDRRGVLATAGAIVLILLSFHARAFAHRIWVDALAALIKVATISASAFVVMGVAGREREARRRLAEEERRIERERLQTREKIQRMDRLATLGTLTAAVAHELNSPLMTILGYAEMILQKSYPPSETERVFNRIEQGARRCRQIIQDMLSFSRQKIDRRKPCDVHALLRECVELKEHDWVLDRIRVEWDLAADMPPIILAGSEFQQVIFNLLANAHHAIRAAARPTGRIRLRTRQEKGELFVAVEDDGPGIPPEIAGRIWEPFFTTKPEGEGTGLGLAICRRIVEGQGGTLTFESSPLGGAAFLIRLPISQAVRRPTGRILVADGDPAVRVLMTRFMARYGSPVVCFESFEEILAALRREPTRLLICDLGLSGMGVFDFFRQMEAEGFLEAVPIVLASASSPNAPMRAFIQERRLIYLAKPFDMAVLEKKVSELIA